MAGSSSGGSLAGVDRRGLLATFGAAGAGALLAGGGAAAFALSRPADSAPPTGCSAVAGHTYSPHGLHQAGITSPKPASLNAVAFTLRPGADKAALARLARRWTADIEALMAGREIPGDPAGELSQAGVSLTVTVGFGPGVFGVPGLERHVPVGLIDIPPMSHDALQDRWSGGDLLLLVSADDETSVAHAVDRLIRDAAPVATPAWIQAGSWRGVDATGRAVTGRNLFGQVDGTANPAGDGLSESVWASEGPAWFAGGTCLVVRRIEMNLDTWNQLSRLRQDQSVGRHVSTGAPLGEADEFAPLDLAATGHDGRPVIPLDAHARRAHPDENSGRAMLRRAWNYQYSETTDGGVRIGAGLIFMAFVANIAKQFVPVQARLDATDALNEWTTAIGSAVFAVPPAWAEGDWLASGLLG